MNFQPRGSNPLTAGFTCNTCGIRFVSADIQRQHMKTDWHRYNLKRRVAELPGISSEVFAEKVLASQKTEAEEEAHEDEWGFFLNHRRKAKGERQMTKKELKQLARGELRGRHLKEDTPGLPSRAHSPAASVASEFSEFSLGDSVELSEVDSAADTASEVHFSDGSEWSNLHHSEELTSESDTDEAYSDEEPTEVFPNHYCFYCGKNNHEIEANVKHMSHKHGLYIPERSFLADLEGLLTFLNEVITADCECLVCGFEGKSVESIRQHVTSKGHCRIPYETKAEKNVISEFYQFDTADKGPVRIDALAHKKKSVSFSQDSAASQYETVDYAEQPDEREAETSEAVLPNGSRIGHRSMVRFQRPGAPAAREWAESEKTVALVDRRFAPGLTGHEVTRQEKDMQRLELKAKNIQVRRTKSAKVNYQRHFRDEMLGHG